MFILFMPLFRTCKTGMNSRPCTGLPERCIAVSAGGFLKDKTLPSFRHIRYFHRRKYNVFFCWANKNAPQHTFLRHNGAICGEKKENGRKMTFPASHPPAVFFIFVSVKASSYDIRSAHRHLPRSFRSVSRCLPCLRLRVPSIQH